MRADSKVAETRTEAIRTEFHANYGSGRDFEGLDLVGFVVSSGRFLGEIVGEGAADRGMAEVVRTLGYECKADEDWASALEEHAFGNAYTWRIGARFHDLNAYAHYGITLSGGRTAEERESWLKKLIEETTAFIKKVPFDAWNLQAGDINHTHRLALGRWALDNDEAIEPYALAEFGGVTERRIRNLMAGSERIFGSEDGGRVPARDALGWLRRRPSFRPSAWREQSTFEDLADTQPLALDSVHFVPVAKDGTIFHRGLARDGVYTVGEEGNELRTASFEEALATLQRLPFPTWRRPSPYGVWTMVRGIRWERLSDEDLERLSISPP
jgi:hypothetical protein